MASVSFCHLINPVSVPESSDLHQAQPITFATLSMARAHYSDPTRIKHLSAHYTEDIGMVPTDFEPTPLLTRSVLDVGTFKVPRKLPLLKDLLDRLYDASVDADYLVFTNVDIAVQPYFYNVLSDIINEGHDAFIINRRTVNRTRPSSEGVWRLMAEVGVPHPGHDCFVFKRHLYSRFQLGNVCIGAKGVDRPLVISMAVSADSFFEFKDLHLTFHIGNERNWDDPLLDDYRLHNLLEIGGVVHSSETTFGDLRNHPIAGEYVSPIMKTLEQLNADNRRLKGGAPAASPGKVARLLQKLRRTGP